MYTSGIVFTNEDKSLSLFIQTQHLYVSLHRYHMNIDYNKCFIDIYKDMFQNNYTHTRLSGHNIKINNTYVCKNANLYLQKCELLYD